jgi:signal transduction histidine kinase
MTTVQPMPSPVHAIGRVAALALHLLRHLAIGAAVSVVVAGFLTLVLDDSFLRLLVFSLCIGFSCQLLIDGGRRLAARWLLQHRPEEAALRRGWPGWRWTLPIILGGSWGGIYLGYPLAAWLLGIAVHNPGLDRPRALFLVLAVSTGVGLVMTYWSWSRARLAASEAQAQAAQRAAAENQLKLLESQLEPHMLFNTLANLRVLIALDAPRAQAMLDHLIAFLRATLDASRAGLHPLADEFARVEDYLALMAVRMGPRLVTQFDLPVSLRELPVPPLLLQPLVENSIKHGLEPKIDGGRIELRAQREGDALVLTVRDNGVGLVAACGDNGGSHFGLEQVRQRLAALYGDRARLTLEARPDGGTETRVTLPCAPLP